jgi:Na+-translocating ferredoxin:NAD+ oxidoreductase subunit D
MAVTFVVSASPHVRTPDTMPRTMWLVVISLLPAAAASAFIFGWRSLAVIGVSVAAAVITEALSQLVFKRDLSLYDGSAVVTGLLLAFTLPSTTPLWITALGAFVAVFLVKQLFGGLGFNIFNPALASRAVLLASFPVMMTAWSMPVTRFLGTDAVSAASALGALKESAARPFDHMQLLLGTVPGSLGETCKIALIAGFLFLLLMRAVDWKIPLSFIGSVALLALVMGRDPLLELLSGGLLLGAFFMATDTVTSPSATWGRVIFGVGCGVLTILIRVYGGFPEGVCYAIILMNCITPLIDRYVVPRRFGAPPARIRIGRPAKGGVKA